jgi:hypothetical protein
MKINIIQPEEIRIERKLVDTTTAQDFAYGEGNRQFAYGDASRQFGFANGARQLAE